MMMLFGKRIVEKCFTWKRILKGWFVLRKSSFGEHKIVMRMYNSHESHEDSMMCQ
jgi:hypothetical protein